VRGKKAFLIFCDAKKQRVLERAFTENKNPLDREVWAKKKGGRKCLGLDKAGSLLTLMRNEMSASRSESQMIPFVGFLMKAG